jgi:predicted TIM-barrel fold metal-dependent hydrolase
LAVQEFRRARQELGLIERMDYTVLTRNLEGGLPSKKLARIYLDCASLGPNAIEIAAKLYGPEKLLLGTDNPIFPLQQALKAVEATTLDASAKTKLLGGNAQKLLNIN